jgi:hemolysin III
MPPRKPTGYRGVFHLVMLAAVWPPVIVLFAVIGSGTLRVSLLVHAVTGLLMSIVSVVTSRTDESWFRWGRLQKADHTMILAFVAGTFTPIATVLDRPRTWHVLIAMWVLVGVRGVLAVLGWDRKTWLTSAIATTSGALPLMALDGLGRPLTIVFVAGQISYLVGAIIYNAEQPKPWSSWCGSHGVFHAFTIVGSVLHLVVSYSLVYPSLVTGVPTAALVVALVVALVLTLVVVLLGPLALKAKQLLRRRSSRAARRATASGPGTCQHCCCQPSIADAEPTTHHTPAVAPGDSGRAFLLVAPVLTGSLERGKPLVRVILGPAGEPCLMTLPLASLDKDPMSQLQAAGLFPRRWATLYRWVSRLHSDGVASTVDLVVVATDSAIAVPGTQWIPLSQLQAYEGPFADLATGPAIGALRDWLSSELAGILGVTLGRLGRLRARLGRLARAWDQLSGLAATFVVAFAAMALAVLAPATGVVIAIVARSF